MTEEVPKRGTIVVVGLGPAGPEYLTSETLGLLESNAPVWLRTARHPGATGLTIDGSFDLLYEELDSFEEVYSTIVGRLIEIAKAHGSVVYGVPGSPSVAERTVELLRSHEEVLSAEVQLDVRPAVAFTDLCWNALGIDPMAEAVAIVDALSLATQVVARTGSLLITQVHSSQVLDDVITLLDDVCPETVTVLQGLGTSSELVVEVPWSDLRSSVAPDHLTSLWVPTLAEPLGLAFVRLDEMIREVRAASRETVEDTLRSLRSQLPESFRSVTTSIDAVMDGADDAAFEFEDGMADLLHQLVLLARVAAEDGLFTIHDLAQAATERRLT